MSRPPKDTPERRKLMERVRIIEETERRRALEEAERQRSTAASRIHSNQQT